MRIPGPGLLEFVLGVRSLGFLDYVGGAWHRYGDTFLVRIGPKSLVLAIHPESVEHVNIGNRANYDKGPSYDGVRKYIAGDGLVTSKGELWKRQRKLMAPFYTPKGVQAYAGLMARDGARLVERWDMLARRGVEVDVIGEMTQVTASIILKAMFSTESPEMIASTQGAVDTMLAYVGTQGPGVRFPLWLPTPLNRRYLRARERVHGSITQLIAQRRAMNEREWPDDLLTRLMQVRDEETGAPMAEGLLRDESITTFFAGHETTARTMTAAWYALAANPKVTEQLHAELDRVLAGRTPNPDDLRSLPYTLQVVKEVLRLYPAAPFYVRDAIGPDRVGGHDIPAGAAVMLSPYYTHRHPQFWENPEVFDPDRWSREREAARHPHAYHPFAVGPRVCIGNNFSLLESHLLLAMLAQKFTLALRPDHRPIWEMQGTLGIANGLPMRIIPRA